MTVLKDPGVFHDDGERDRRRNHDRVRQQIAERLRDQVGDEELITAGPEHTIRVPVTGQREWRFIFDRQRQQGVGQSDGVGEGDVIDLGTPDGEGQPGGEGAGEGGGGGEVTYEVELDMEEVEQHLFEQLGLPRLAPRGLQQERTEHIFFDDRARKGPLLDKKATIRANLKRNAQAGKAGIGDFDRDDLRYLTFREQMRPSSQAVVFLVMDVSGSMGQFERRIARLFFWWATRFLRHRYTTTEVVFIAHHSAAIECDEQQFFSIVDAGGTRCSSAYELLLDIQRQRYPVADWNIFVAHCSDGDNWDDDNERLVGLLNETAEVANLVGYCQIERSTRYHWSGEHLLGILTRADIPNVVCHSVGADTEVWAALRAIFRPDDAEVLT